MITRLMVFGASGDLTGRFLLPALAALHAKGNLPAGFGVVGAAGQEWDDDAFRRFASERLERHAADVPAAAREALVGSLRYRQVDVATRPALPRSCARARWPPAVSRSSPTWRCPSDSSLRL